MSSRKNDIAGSITGLVALLATAAFLLIGFTTHVWHPTWMLFLAIPIMSIIVDIATHRRDIAGKVTGVVAILATVGFLLMGFLGNLWHPGWIIFLAVPISGVIVKMFAPDSDKHQQNGQDTPQ